MWNAASHEKLSTATGPATPKTLLSTSSETPTTNATFCTYVPALGTHDRASNPLLYEIAQEILDILNNPDRQAIVDELLSPGLAAELNKRVSHPNGHGIWQARKAIAHLEATLSKHARYIRNRLECSDSEATRPTCSHDFRPMGDGEAKRSPSPLATKGTCTPTTSTANDSETANSEHSSVGIKVG